MNSIGAVLKEARTKKSISLEEVHSKIKIHPRVLQLLEEDKFEKLPSPLFVKSFLKSYAEFLEVNPDALVDTYEKEKKKDPEQILFIKLADPAVGQGFRPFWVFAGIGGALLLLFVMLGEPSKLAKSWTSKKPKKISAVKVREEVPRESSVLVKEGAAAASAPARVAGDESLNSAALKNFPRLNKKTPLTLEIKALDAVWVHVTSDGSIVFQGVLKKDSFQQWIASQSIEIWTGNASNMALTLNKYSLGSPGKGVVKKMIISHEGVRIAAPSA